MSEKRGDVVYTPEWVAKDMLTHFAPSGIVLDPCRGLGAFHDLLPEGSPWCEITDGRDFFEWTDHVDWTIGNPPYSLTRPWFRHSYEIADHLCYLVPCRNVWSGYGFLREIHQFGGIREIRTYGTGGRLGFPMGNAVAAFHIERGWQGPTVLSFYDSLRPEPEPTPVRVGQLRAMPVTVGMVDDTAAYVLGRGWRPLDVVASWPVLSEPEEAPND